MIPEPAQNILLYYAALTALSLYLILRRRPRKGMRLRLRGQDLPTPLVLPTQQYTHIQAKGERPVNVVFNYNGHSWDAYEVLGLPAGSSLEKVETSFHSTINTVDAGSRPFLRAAYQAIQTEWGVFKATGTR